MKSTRGCVLDYPQSGERIRGAATFRKADSPSPTRNAYGPAMIGSGDLWVTEFVLRYDGIPSTCEHHGILRRTGGHETQYFADRFEPGPSRRIWSSARAKSDHSRYAPRRIRIGIDVDEIS